MSGLKVRLSRIAVLPASLLLLAAGAGASEYYALSPGRQHLQGELDGTLKIWSTADDIRTTVEASNGINTLVTLDDEGAVYRLGSTTGTVEHIIDFGAGTRDIYVTGNDQIFALTADGVEKVFSYRRYLIAPIMHLPPNSVAIAVDDAEEHLLVVCQAVVATYDLRSSPPALMNQEPVTGGQDAQLGLWQGQSSAVVVDELGIREYLFPTLEVLPVVPATGLINVAWRCDAASCRPKLVQSQVGDVFEVKSDGTLRLLATIPPDSRMTSSAGGLENIAAAGSDGTGSPSAPRVRFLYPNVERIEISNADPAGVWVDTGDLVGDAGGGPGDGMTDAVLSLYSPQGYNTVPEIIQLYSYDPQVRDWLKTASVVPYAATQYGATVAVVELEPGKANDPTPASEIVTGPGPGAIFGPQARAFRSDTTPIAKINFYAYGTLKHGVNVGSGGPVADHRFLTGPGPGDVFGPHVRGWDFGGGALQPMGKVNFFAYGTLKYGVNVNMGDHDADGLNEFLTGPGPGPMFPAQVRGWNFDDQAVRPIPQINHIARGRNSQGNWVNGYYGARAIFAEYGTVEVIASSGPDPNLPKADLEGFRYDGKPSLLFRSIFPSGSAFLGSNYP